MNTRKILLKVKELVRESTDLQEAVDRKIVSTVKSLLKGTNSSTLDFKYWQDEVMDEGRNTVLLILKHNLYAAGAIVSVTLTKDSYRFDIIDEAPETGVPADLTLFDASELLKTLLEIKRAAKNGYCRITGNGTVVPAEMADPGYRIVPTIYGSRAELEEKGIDPDTVYASKKEASDSLINGGLSHSDYNIEEVSDRE